MTPFSLLFGQVSHKFNLIYVITKLGLLFVYDLETASAIYRNRISPDPIFLTSEASSVGGFYAINRRGQVLLATVNEATIIPFISMFIHSGNSVAYINNPNPNSMIVITERRMVVFRILRLKSSSDV